MAKSKKSDKPWYSKGLCFTCTSCGDCCRHHEGYVWVDPPTIRRIADYLKMDQTDFTQKYVRKVDNELSLVEKPNLDCIFWEGGCTIYPVRPMQCRTFPFWSENIESEEAWQEENDCCPGMGQGRLYSQEEIETLARGTGDTGDSEHEEASACED